MSSLLLPGFKMPEFCEKCPCSSEYYDSKWDEYDLYCSCTGDRVDTERFGDFDNVKKPDNCPLVEIPSDFRIIVAKPNKFPTPHRKELNDYMKGWNTCLRSVWQSELVLQRAKEEEA